MKLETSTLLKMRNNDELFFKYILRLAIDLIVEEDDVAGLEKTFKENQVKYILEFIFKACVLSSFLINETEEMSEEELITHSKINFERIKKYIETKKSNYNYLLEEFHKEVDIFLEN